MTEKTTIAQKKVIILSNKQIAKDCYKLILSPAPFLLKISPGQFVHIRIGDGISPFLRRPFSISKVTENGVEIIYKVVGRGTKLLTTLKKGEQLDILGVLGKGFRIDESKKTHFLIGGGVGVAPLVFLAQKIAQKINKASILVFLGFETSNKVICLEEFPKKAVLYLATEDGSFGYKGLVSHLFQEYLNKVPLAQDAIIYACGPVPMLKAVVELAFTQNIPTQVLLESIIGCGVGVCRGCVIKGKKGYLRVCKEGPVFDAKEVLMEEL